MRRIALVVFFILLIQNLFGQSKPSNPEHAPYLGTYQSRIDTGFFIVIKEVKEQMILEIVHQGEVALEKIGPDKFKPGRVRPKTVVEFLNRQGGKFDQLNWVQPIQGLFFKRTPSAIDTVRSTSDLSRYVGNYKLGNRVAEVRAEGNHLTFHNQNEGKLLLTQDVGNRFVLKDEEMVMNFDFIPDASGKIQEMKFSRTGPVRLKRVSSSAEQVRGLIYGFDRSDGFTRADTLRGALTSLRTCYDVLFYDLDVTFQPTTKSVKGANTIRFKATADFTQLQLDLFSNMAIEKILYHGANLPFTRELNAVFVRFPEIVHAGTQDQLTVYYSGQPQQPDLNYLAGGILWLSDKENNPWIETVTQGSGASLWWPCKDHLSDKPDSMRIQITVPHGLTDISNGRLKLKTELPNNLTRFEWYVSYPITTYDVVANIGSYVKFTAKIVRHGDTLKLNYYSKPYDVAIGKKIFQHVKPMLGVFEKYFGDYPFHRDEFTLLESLYPMEHQSAVTFGSIFLPFNGDTYDSTDLKRLVWHESAHEWWGNSITVKDYADMWIHEAFATYAEVLAYEKLVGPAAAEKYMKDQVPENKEPVIGQYGVNDFRLGDMYPKGALMLHTLRNVLNNDSVWFSLLRGIQQHFKFQTITTEDLVQYINSKTGTDFTHFFDQYLRYPKIPQLQVQFEKKGASTVVRYRWKTDVSQFKMPVKVTTKENEFTFIYPEQEWKVLDLGKLPAKKFKVDVQHFYVEVKEIR